MTILSFPMPAVALKAQDMEFSVDPADFSAVALEGIFTYGIRRWFQDYINSQAFTFKEAAKEASVKGEAFNDGKPFDVQACFLARLEMAKTGQLSAPRNTAGGPSFTLLQDALYTLLVDHKGRAKPLADAWKATKGEPTPARKLAMLKAFEQLSPEGQAALTAMAQAKVDADAAIAALF